MKRTTSVVQLKSKTSELLRQVKAGHEVVITERGVPIARLLPLDDAERRTTRRARLSRNGVIKTGRGKVPRILATPPEGEPVGDGVVRALLAERDESGGR